MGTQALPALGTVAARAVTSPTNRTVTMTGCASSALQLSTLVAVTLLHHPPRPGDRLHRRVPRGGSELGGASGPGRGCAHRSGHLGARTATSTSARRRPSPGRGPLSAGRRDGDLGLKGGRGLLTAPGPLRPLRLRADRARRSFRRALRARRGRDPHPRGPPGSTTCAGRASCPSAPSRR